MKPKNLWLLITSLCLAVSQTGYAALLHVILVADTTSPTGPAAAADLVRVEKEFEKVAHHTGLVCSKKVFQGSETKPLEVLTALHRLPVAADDVVVFYFLGHGYRTSNKVVQWPNLYFSECNQGVDLGEILQMVIAKRPRFALMVADCCNNVIDGEVRLEAFSGFAQSVLSGRYKKLFLESTGVLVVAAAQAGDYAYCYEEGHVFSESFWQCFHRNLKSPQCSWTQILKDCSVEIQDLQTPIYETLVYP